MKRDDGKSGKQKQRMAVVAAELFQGTALALHDLSAAALAQTFLLTPESDTQIRFERSFWMDAPQRVN